MCRLALALGRPLAEVMDLSAAELAVWAEYHAEGGFPFERDEWGRALAAAYTGGVMGGKVRPAELLPSRGRKRTTAKADREAVKAWFLGRAKKGGE